MSILDPLSQQVIGTGPIPPERERGAPRLEALDATRAVQALRSDSRLDPRQFSESLDQAGRGAPEPLASERGIQRNTMAAQPSASQETTSLSATARTIAAALAVAPEPSAASGAMPLNVHPETLLLAALVTELAEGIRTGVEHSGLFYESHLARWFAGAYPAAQLAEEPQMRAARLAQAIIATRTARARVSGDEAAAHGAASSQVQATGSTENPGGMPPHVASVVHQQLQTLADPGITLQVAPWPGAHLTLRMVPAWHWHPERRGRRRPGPKPSRPWTVDIRLQTRHMGTLTTRIDFTSERVAVRFKVAHDAAARMHVGAERLRRRLAVVGSQQVEVAIVEEGDQAPHE